MKKASIPSFFTPISAAQYEAQVQRSLEEYALNCEAAQTERVVRQSVDRRQRQEEQRGPGRPRKQPSIVVQNNSHTSVTISIDDHSNGPVSPGPNPLSSGTHSPSPAVMSESSTSPSSTSSSSTSSSSSSAPSSAPPVKLQRRDWLSNGPLFAIIDATVQSCRSYAGAVRKLQEDKNTASSFEALTESTVRSWYEPKSFVLKAAVKRRLEGPGEKVERSGRPGFLSQYPDIGEYVIEAITNIRAAHGTINSLIINSLFRAYVKAKYPNRFKRRSFGRGWCRKWLARTLPWTYKRGTTSGQKLPLDWEEQCEGMVKRVSAKAAQHNILHPSFIINWDQTAVLLMSANNSTYSHVKEKQVPMIGQDEKRQITAVVTSTLDGDLLPLQLIFKGQDKNKKQQKAVPSLNSITTRRTAGWHLTQTENHWSSLESMKDFIRIIIHPYIQAKGRQHNVTVPHCVLLLDCWSVHTSKEFRDWMTTCYPRYHLVYVPAGCTGKAQPADVGLQRPFKHTIKSAFTYWLTDEIHHTIKGGKAPSEVKINTSIVTLKPLLVDWTWQSWYKLKGKRDVIRQGWERCGLGKVLDKAQQAEAMRYCLNEPVQAVGDEPHRDEVADSEGEEEEEEGEGEND